MQHMGNTLARNGRVLLIYNVIEDSVGYLAPRGRKDNTADVRGGVTTSHRVVKIFGREV